MIYIKSETHFYKKGGTVMLNKVFDQFLKGLLESKEEELLKNKNYREAINNYMTQYNNVKSNLPEDNAFEIIDKLDSANASISGIEKEFYYKQGFQDCIRILTHILADSAEDTIFFEDEMKSFISNLNLHQTELKR